MIILGASLGTVVYCSGFTDLKQVMVEIILSGYDGFLVGWQVGIAGTGPFTWAGWISC